MNIDFNKGDGLIPVVIQDYLSMNVLMLGYMNKTAFEKTQKEGKVTFYSRNKARLWTKGETSNNFLWVKEMKLDCDQDTLLIKAKADGPTCHLGNTTCFEEDNNNNAKRFLYQLENTISERIDNNEQDSYTNNLYKKGINKVAQKVGEEAVELVIEAKDSNDVLFKNEAADLMYHYLLLLKAKGFTLQDIEAVLMERA